MKTIKDRFMPEQSADIRKVIRTFSRNGLAYLFKRVRIRKKQPADRGARFRKSLEELGPTYVKLGQMLSTRYDVMPKDIIDELQKLQDNVPAFPYKAVIQMLDEEYGDHKKVFRSIEAKPLASASIGQVHRARLLTGEDVVIKVRRPRITEIINGDIVTLKGVAKFGERMPFFEGRELYSLVREFSKNIKKELNLQNEAKAMARFNRAFARDKMIFAPRPYLDLCRPNILVMDYVDGIRFSDLLKRGYKPPFKVSKKKLVKALANSMLEMVFIHGFVHGDPHPGNLIVTKRGELCYLDFGAIVEVDPEMQRFFLEFLVAMTKRDAELLSEIMSDNFYVHEQDTYVDDIKVMFSKYHGLPLSEIDLGEIMTENFRINRKHQILIPPQIFLIGKVILLLEGVGRKLDPDFDFIGFLKDYFTRKRVVAIMKDRFLQLQEDSLWKAFMLPRRLNKLEKLLTGGVNVQMNLPKIERRMDLFIKAVNALALAVIMAGLIMSIDKFPYPIIVQFIIMILSIYILFHLLNSYRKM